MLSTDSQGLQTKLMSFCRGQIQEAGARYTPGVDPDAPNLEIEQLSQVLSFLAFDADCPAWFRSFEDMFKKFSARTYLNWSAEIQQVFARLITDLAKAPTSLIAGETTAVSSLVLSLKELTGVLESEIQAARTKLDALETGKDTDAVREKSDIQLRNNELFETQRQVISAANVLQTATGSAVEKRQLLLLGPWGTGKTHFLCDRVSEYLASERPALLILAKTPGAQSSPLAMLCKSLGRSNRIDALVSDLAALTGTSGSRFLIVVDGVNEGARKSWRAAVRRLSDLVAADPRLSLLVSCRSPLETECIPADVVDRFASISHPGFADLEFDAQAEFFRYYKLSLPAVPLLDEEFSRPLTLKIICDAFKDLSRSGQKKGFEGLSSGQKGMTFVLERYIDTRAKPLEQQYNLPNRGIWQLIKGVSRGPGPPTPGFAATMASKGLDTVTRKKALILIRAFFPALSAIAARQLLDAMRVQGILDEDISYTRRGRATRTSTVLRLPYQRFSDHIIARHLLEKALAGCQTAQDIQSLFSTGGALHKIFRRSRYSGSFEMRGWAEALIVEFPERIRRLRLPRQELYHYLPEAAKQKRLYCEPFISGLLWRASSSFSDDTIQIVNFLLENGNWREVDLVLDALVSIGVRAKHSFSAGRLYDFLATKSLTARDLKWSEYVREKYKSPAVRRLLHWVEMVDPEQIDSATAEPVVIILSLLLTSTVHATRDRATRCLVRIGEAHWSLLFGHTLKTLSLNDAYVPERMLAACYGVMLSLTPAPSEVFVQDAVLFAKSLYKEITSAQGNLKTYHSRIRDYKDGVFIFVERLAPTSFTASQIRTIKRRQPYPNPFPDATNIDDQVQKTVARAIQMDFETYVLPRILRGKKSRHSHSTQITDVKRQIEWRIADLGFTQQEFGQLDQTIAAGSWRRNDEAGSRVDRYGKKYSWIAYYEMMGWQNANDTSRRPNDGFPPEDRDIDPAAPTQTSSQLKAAAAWPVPTPQLVEALGGGPLVWMRGENPTDYRPMLKLGTLYDLTGPWIMIQGFVDQHETSTRRNAFTFLRGLFVQQDKVAALKNAFLKKEYPGNREIPDGISYPNQFAGELGFNRFSEPGPWSPKLRVLKECFDSEERIGRAPTGLELAEGKPFVEDENGMFHFSIPSGPRIRWRKIPGIEVEIPYEEYSWSKSTGESRETTRLDIPNESFLRLLDLHMHRRDPLFRCPDGTVASIYLHREKEGSASDSESLLYVRADLLDAYLQKTDQVLVWCIWGERNLRVRDNDPAEITPEHREILDKHNHIQRQFVEKSELV